MRKFSPSIASLTLYLNGAVYGNISILTPLSFVPGVCRSYSNVSSCIKYIIVVNNPLLHRPKKWYFQSHVPFGNRPSDFPGRLECLAHPESALNSLRSIVTCGSRISLNTLRTLFPLYSLGSCCTGWSWISLNTLGSLFPLNTLGSFFPLYLLVIPVGPGSPWIP